MLIDEKEPLLTPSRPAKSGELTMIFAMACIVDQFGVNPIIVLPRAIILCGWIGIPLALLVFGLTIYTAMLLGRCWVMAEIIDPSIIEKSRYPYAALAEMAWGRRAGSMMSIFLNIAVFTGNIPALLIASQNLQTFDSKISNFVFNFSYCYWLIILGIALCPLTWLGSPKDMKWISVASSCAVLSAAILTWTCMVWDNTRAFAFRDIPSPNWQSIAIAYGILSFQLSCHPAMLAIQSDMHNKTQLSQSILCSFFVTGGLFLITTCMVMMLYGGGVRANLTQGLPSTLPLYMDILLITLQLFLSMAVGGCALFQAVEDKLSVPRELCWQRCLLRTFFVMLTVLIAAGLPRFDLVMGLLGGLFTGPITLIFPPLLYARFKMLLSNSINTKLNENNEDISHDEMCSASVSDIPADKKEQSEESVSNLKDNGDVSHATVQLPEDRSSLSYPTEETEDSGKRLNLYSEKLVKRSEPRTSQSSNENNHERGSSHVESTKHFRGFEYYFKDFINKCRPRYLYAAGNKLIKKYSFSLHVNLEDCNLTKWEKIMLWTIAALGVLATLTATYYSLRGTVWSAKFLPPCLINVKSASKIIDS